MSLDLLAVFVVRVGLCILFFPFSALDKVFNFTGAVKQASETFSWRPLAVVAILIGMAVEVFASLGVITGVADRLSAFILGGYCAVTALLWKRFWAQADFWSGGVGRSLFWDFLKNLSLGSGFLLITLEPHGAGLAALLAHPLASTHPYAGAPHG